MAVSHWRYPRQISIINFLTRCAQQPNDIADLDRFPHQDRVRQQTQTARLIHNLLVVTGAKLAAIGEEQPAGQFMPRFASIELQLHPSSNLLLVDAAQYEDRLDDPAERRQRFSDSIRWRGAAQTLEHYVGGHQAVTETRRHSR